VINSIIDAEIALVKLYDDMGLCFEENTKELEKTKETKDASVIQSCTEKVKTLRSGFVSDNVGILGQVSIQGLKNSGSSKIPTQALPPLQQVPRT
jgi:hypothetical protein